MNPIHINAISVELSEYHKQLITRNLAPLLRLVPQPNRARAVVVIRYVRRPLGGTQYYVMVRLHAVTQDYYAVGMDHFLMRAVKASCHDLRHTLSRTYQPDIQTIEQLRHKAHERMFVELFAS